MINRRLSQSYPGNPGDVGSVAGILLTDVFEQGDLPVWDCMESPSSFRRSGKVTGRSAAANQQTHITRKRLPRENIVSPARVERVTQILLRVQFQGLLPETLLRHSILTFYGGIDRPY